MHLFWVYTGDLKTVLPNPPPNNTTTITLSSPWSVGCAAEKKGCQPERRDPFCCPFCPFLCGKMHLQNSSEIAHFSRTFKKEVVSSEPFTYPLRILRMKVFFIEKPFMLSIRSLMEQKSLRSPAPRVKKKFFPVWRQRGLVDTGAFPIFWLSLSRGGPTGEKNFFSISRLPVGICSGYGSQNSKLENFRVVLAVTWIDSATYI